MNITIRKMQPGDADALYKLLSDPEVMQHLEPPFDREKQKRFCITQDCLNRRLCMPPKPAGISSAM